MFTQSNLSIKINISSLFKSSFETYYTSIIMPNKHRIHSINLSDPFIMDLFSSPTEHISKCSQLQVLILNEIESKCLENLLSNLACLPKFSSLAIALTNDLNVNNISSLICQLPVFKYCKLSAIKIETFKSLPKSNGNVSSSIEHLVINGDYDHIDLDDVLSYVLQLCRLSIDCLTDSDEIETIEYCSNLNNLTYLQGGNS
ncbi:unnamed protein product [Rotaria sp. Silwood2]|nr:unnamed protein product [Rotaria sp. Silwood2]